MEALDLEVATEFLLIAATLVELKTRRLLPGRDDVDLDDELALWEERDLLLARLLECKTFKDAAAVLGRAGRRGRPARAPARPASTSASSRSRPTCWPASPPDDLRAAFLRAVDAQAGAPGRPRPRRPDPGQRHRRRRRAASTSCPGSGRITFRRAHRPRWSSGSRSSCGSSPSSSCSSRAWSTSTRPRTFGDIDDRAGLGDDEADDGRRSTASTSDRRLRGLTAWPTEAATGRSRRSSWWPTSRSSRSCWPSCSRCRRRGSRSSAPSWPPSYEAEDRGFVLVRVAGGYRFQSHPDLARLRRALRARGPVGPAVGRRPRDPGHRRLQAAGLPGPGRAPSAASTSTA